MKARPLRLRNGEFFEVEPSKATYLEIIIPGPSGRRTFPIILKGQREGTGCWTWNGDTDKPTLRPSVLTTSGHFIESQNGKECWCNFNKQNPDKTPVFQCYRCHTWINDGKAQFLGDCSHELANQTLDLLDV
jgi:Family of unknown function (DUF6527)